MFNIEPIDISKMTLDEIMKMNGYLYKVVDTTNKTIEEKAEAVSEADRLKSMSVEDLANDPKYSEIFEDTAPVEEPKKNPKYDKYYNNMDRIPKKTNQAPYITTMSTMSGDIWIIPKSNGCMKLEFDDKSKAEVFLKKVKYKLHYSTNPVDAVSVMDLYNLLNIVVPPDIKRIAEKYEWATVSSLCDLKWISSSVTKCVDRENVYGWCITKRASKKKEN